VTTEPHSTLTGIPVARLSCGGERARRSPGVDGGRAETISPGDGRGQSSFHEEDFWDEYYPIISSHDWEESPAYKKKIPNMLWSENDPRPVFTEYTKCRRCGYMKARIEGQEHSYALCNPQEKIIAPITCNEGLMRRVIGG
jgi:hypothetical protein